MDEQTMICAYAIDGEGRGKELQDNDVISQMLEEGRLLWLHFNRESDFAEKYIKQYLPQKRYILESLLAEETRPRCEEFPEGLLVILRGVNTNPGSDPADMVSIRVFISKNLIISVRVRKLLAIHDIRDSLEHEKGPKTTGEFVVKLSQSLLGRMENVINELDDTIDNFEEQIIQNYGIELRHQIIELRSKAIKVRRYIAPQREAINRLLHSVNSIISDTDKLQLRESLDHLTRYIETLDVIRERSMILQDEIMSRVNDKLNKNTYVLSIVAAIFLPLSFITGLLGINVGGIPGASDTSAFLVVSGALCILAVIQLVYLRYKKWL